jgi:glycosyltransferase involved in cell wall biosynthesis
MKILLTTHQFFPQFAAGTEVLTYSVARELIKRGHRVHVLTGHPGSVNLADEDRFDEYEFEGIRVYRFHHAYTPMGGQVSMITVGYDNRLGADYFDRILMSFKPDVVHFFHLNRLGTGLIERAVQADIARFMTPTDFWTICPTGQLLLGDGSLCTGPSAHAGNCLKHFAKSTQGRVVGKITEWLPTAGADLLVRLTKKGTLPAYPKQVEVIAIADRLAVNISRLNQLNGLIVPNRFMKDLLIRHGVVPELITEAAFGIDVTTPEVFVQRSNNRGTLSIGFIGTIASHKGCHLLVEAFKMLPPHKATLKIYGRLEDFPDYTSELKLLVGNHQSIEFCGTFANSKIAQVFADIDVLVVPSLWYENTPLVLYSAQAAYCPVIASNLPGLAEVIQHDVNGLLFEPDYSADLAQQLSRLINEDGLLQRLSSKARLPKSTEKYVDELLTLWKSVE